MMGSTHLLAGAVAALALGDPVSPAGALCLLGSLAPDLDAGPRAMIANPFRLPLLNLPIQLAAWAARRATGHRGWLHRAPALIAVWGLWYWMRGPWLGLAVGWSTHVALDMLTKRGIKLFGRKAWRLPKPFRIRTGGRAEQWLVRPALLIALAAAGYQMVRD